MYSSMGATPLAGSGQYNQTAPMCSVRNRVYLECAEQVECHAVSDSDYLVSGCDSPYRNMVRMVLVRHLIGRH